MRYLYKRRQGYYARVAVPLHLRTTLGRADVVRTLGTNDLGLAKRKLHGVVADIQREFMAAEANRVLPPESADYIISAAKEARAAVNSGLQTEEEAERGLHASVDNHLELLARQRGTDPETGDPLISDGHVRAINIAHKVFEGQPLTLFSDQAEQYLSEVAAGIRKSTVLDKRKALESLRGWLNGDVEVGSVTRKMAGQYTGQVLAKRPVTSKRTKTELSHLSAFWTWMLARGVVEVNVWVKMGASLPTSKRGTEAPRRPWTDAEVLTLVKNTPTDDPLWSLSVLALYSGARIEELCSLKVADVVGDVLRIREGKSSAAVRAVPVHPVIAPLVRQLVKTASDGWLIPGLLTGGRDARRSAGASKRFGYHLRHHLKLTDRALTFHSFRNSFINRARAAGVPLLTAKEVVGHESEDLTYGHYSGALSTAERAAVVAKVSYGAADALVRRTAGKVKITFRSHRRPPKVQRAA